MNDGKGKEIKLTRPTFSELATMLGKSGMVDSLGEDGRIYIGNHYFVAEDSIFPSPGRAARMAAQIASTAGAFDCNEDVFNDGEISLTSHCRLDGVHVVEQNLHDTTSRAVKIPYKALMPLAGDLIECLGRHRK